MDKTALLMTAICLRLQNSHSGPIINDPVCVEHAMLFKPLTGTGTAADCGYSEERKSLVLGDWCGPKHSFSSLSSLLSGYFLWRGSELEFPAATVFDRLGCFF